MHSRELIPEALPTTASSPDYSSLAPTSVLLTGPRNGWFIAIPHADTFDAAPEPATFVGRREHPFGAE